MVVCFDPCEPGFFDVSFHSKCAVLKRHVSSREKSAQTTFDIYKQRFFLLLSDMCKFLSQNKHGNKTCVNSVPVCQVQLFKAY